MQPQEYERLTDFTERDGDDTDHSALNQEFDSAALSVNQIRDNLALIQKDDGTLKNGIVTADSLDDSAFDALSADVNQAVIEAQTAATSANNAATSANTARDQAQAAKISAETAQNASSLNATNAAANAASANISKVAAETAETNAETAESNAEAAQVASEAARDTANTHKNDAQTAKTLAESARDVANTKAGEASASASAAAISANTATSKASEAAASAVQAANSAASAALALDNFDDRYLGPKAADPTLDNDGNALQLGALYSNTVTGKMRFYTALGWVDASSAAVAALNTFEYVMSAGQTLISGNDVNGVSLSYTAGGVMLSINGSLVRPGDDYTASNGTTITLANAAVAGDEVVVYAFGNFTVADTYSRAEADALLAAKANQVSTYTKTEIDTALATKQAALTNITAGKVLGRDTSGSGVLQELPIAVDASGKVGIGTNTPTQPLDVNGQIKLTQGLRVIPSASDLYSVDSALSNYAANNGVYLNGNTNGWLRLSADGTTSLGASINLTGVSYVEPKLMQFFTNNLERMRIDAVGRVTKPYQPAFKAGDNPGYVSASLISFVSTSLNIGNHWNGSNTFTAPIAGVYWFGFSGMSTTAGATSNVAIRVNGGSRMNSYTKNDGYSRHNINILIYLNANDAVTLYLEHGGLHDSWDSFSGCLLG